MNKKDIERGQIYIEKLPSKHTSKLHKVEVLNVRSHYETTDKKRNGKWVQRNISYVYTKTCEGQYYPAANSTDKHPMILDGLVGCMKLSQFKAQYKLNS